MRVGEDLCKLSISGQDFCLKVLNSLSFFYQQMGQFMSSILLPMGGFFAMISTLVMTAFKKLL